jgi:hypothetical protein
MYLRLKVSHVRRGDKCQYICDPVCNGVEHLEGCQNLGECVHRIRSGLYVVSCGSDTLDGSWDMAGACEASGGLVDSVLNKLLVRYFRLMWNFGTSYSNLLAYLCIH